MATTHAHTGRLLHDLGFQIYAQVVYARDARGDLLVPAGQFAGRADVRAARDRLPGAWGIGPKTLAVIDAWLAVDG